MSWRAYLDNQTGRHATLLPNEEYATFTRYISIEGRNIPIILTDEESKVTQSCAVGVNDGKNPTYQLGYEAEGDIQITLVEKNGILRYNVTSGFTTYTNLSL